MSRFFFSLLVLATAGCSTGDSHESASHSIPRVDFGFREGQRLFVHYCSPCHGEEGDGFGKYYGYGLKPQPADFTAPDFLQTRSDSVLFLAISERSASLNKSNLCPPWGNTFRRGEIGYFITFIKALNRETNTGQASGSNAE